MEKIYLIGDLLNFPQKPDADSRVGVCLVSGKSASKSDNKELEAL
jgi:hypothetical protein